MAPQAAGLNTIARAEASPARARETLLAAFGRPSPELLQDAYLALHEGLRWGRVTIDPYAASSPAEFFAVTTELYFEDVDALSEHAPVVPTLLKDYYGVEAYGARARQLN